MSGIVSQVKASTLPQSTTSSEQNVLTAAKGGGITFVASAIAYVLRFVIGIVLARSLGAEQYGLYGLTLTAATIASGLGMLGLGQALVRYVSLFASRHDTAGLWGALQVGLGLTAIMSLLIGIGLYALATPIAEQLFHEPKLVPLLRLSGLFVPFLALTDTLAAATRGFNKMQYTAIGRVSQPLMKLVLLMVLVTAVGLNATNVIAVHIFVVSIVGVALLYSLNRLFPLIRPHQKGRRDIKEMLKFSLPLYVTYLIGTLRGNVQTVLLGALNTVSTVGVFTVAAQVNQISQMFRQSITTVSMPIVSELHSRGEREQMGRFYQTMTRWMFTLNLPLFLILSLFPTAILSIFGKSFVGGKAALTILAWGNLAISSRGICGVMINMTGNTRLNIVNALVSSVLVLGLNFLLIPRWGITGAAIAALMTAVINRLLALSEIFIVFRLLPYNMSFLKPIAAGLAATAAALVMRRLLPSEASLFYTVVDVAILLTVYVSTMLLLGLSEEDHMVLARLRRRLNIMYCKGFFNRNLKT